jgi:hypothetical protein
MEGRNALSLVKFYQHTITIVVMKGCINPALVAQATMFNRIKMDDENFPLYVVANVAKKKESNVLRYYLVVVVVVVVAVSSVDDDNTDNGCCTSYK